MKAGLFTSFFVLANCVFQDDYDYKCPDPPKIAIIGAGIGGTSCSYFLTELFGTELYLDVFEAVDVGGRLKTAFVGPHVVEIGGSVIHPRNRYMLEFLEKLGINKKDGFEGRLGIFNGEKMVYEESNWMILDVYRMFRRYGYDVVRIRYGVEKMLNGFERIYELQDEGKTFVTVDDMLNAMDEEFPVSRSVSIRNSFAVEYHKQTYHELILSAMKVNYGQGSRMHQFVAWVSLAGAMPGLWAVHGGNKMIPEKLLNASSAYILRTAVTRIKYHKAKNQYEVFLSARQPLFPTSKFYDVVVLAAPMTNDGAYPIYFDGDFDPQHIITFKDYHVTFCTIIEGELNHEYFGYVHAADCPTEILTYIQTFFNSISRVTRMEDISVWKVFSNEPLTIDEIEVLFIEYRVVTTTAWEAYPEYNSEPLDDTFVLHNNLYYLNAIEMAASAMEMSVVSAKNIALMIHQAWRNATDHVECKPNLKSEYFLKTEL